MLLDPNPSYPASLAFVVKLHRSCQPATGLWRGRIEHVASGEHQDFFSVDELMFWLRCLAPPLTEAT